MALPRHARRRIAVARRAPGRYNRCVTLAEAVAIFVLSAGASLVQSLTGLGFGLMIVPPLVMVVGAKDAVVVSNVLGAVLSAVLLLRSHGHVEWRTGATLFASTLVGMPVGLLVLVWIDPGLLQVVIALTVIVFTVLLARGMRLHAAGLLGDIVTGFTSGILRMSTSMSGPPVVIYLQGRGISSERFRATLAAFFTAGGLVGAILFAAAGRIDADTGRQIGAGLPALAAGVFTGNALYRRIDEGLFRRAVFAVLFSSSALAIVTALAP